MNFYRDLPEQAEKLIAKMKADPVSLHDLSLIYAVIYHILHLLYRA